MFKLTSDQVSELASQLTVEEIATLPEVIILGMVTQRLGHTGQYGFMLQESYFSEKNNLSEILFALMERLNKIEDKEK